jgi:hypothetical protein
VEEVDAYGNVRSDLVEDAVLDVTPSTGATVDGSSVEFGFAPSLLPTGSPFEYEVTASANGFESDPVTVLVDAAAVDLHVSVGSSTRAAPAAFAAARGPMAASAGGTATLAVSALDVDGGTLGDVSGFVTVTSDDPDDVVTGSTVRFAGAGPRTLTIDYGILSTEYQLDVAALEPLATTGSTSVVILPAALILLLLGLWLTQRHRVRAGYQRGSR